jgi:hypothetical protein
MIRSFIPFSNRLCAVGLLATVVATHSALAQANPTWQGRPFVRVLAKGDPIPGTPGAIFNVIENFTLRDGKLHIVAGEGQSKKGLFRWQAGVLTKLVYTDTMAPTGSTFDTVHFTTDETEGALNFSGEVFFGRPGFVYGLFEWRNGVITKVFDSATPVAGKTLNGFGYPVRVGHEVVGSAQFFEGDQMKNGILRWDGTTLRTVIQTGDDLPGSLGGYTGQPARYQVAFDGQNVGFVASDDPQGKGPLGIYRAAPDGTITKLIDGNDAYPFGGTYAEVGLSFVNVDLDGTNSFLGVSELVSAAGGNSFYGPGYRYSGGTLDVATATFGTDGKFEQVLKASALLDGKKWTNVQLVDGQGDDVALLVRLADGTQAIYAAIASGVTPPAAPVLSKPTLAGGKVTLKFVSAAGVSYRVEFKAALGDATWIPRGNLAGTGAEMTFTETAAAAGFYRVVPTT